MKRYVRNYNYRGFEKKISCISIYCVSALSLHIVYQFYGKLLVFNVTCEVVAIHSTEATTVHTILIACC